jgi:hypothetical protein
MWTFLHHQKIYAPKMWTFLHHQKIMLQKCEHIRSVKNRPH